MVRSPKSIGGAVGSRLGDAPYKIGVLLRSVFGIALRYSQVLSKQPIESKNTR
ncbi:MAG: hypothetical protein RPG89_10765 [Microcystis panniformis WG22]|nr:hypothetical protein [Microcystis panniformis WG22]